MGMSDINAGWKKVNDYCIEKLDSKGMLHRISKAKVDKKIIFTLWHDGVALEYSEDATKLKEMVK